jgi:hypothetical protein
VVLDCDKITFIASLPPIKSAIILDGNGDGGQVKFDVPRSDVMKLIQVQGMSRCSLKVTVERSDNDQ